MDSGTANPSSRATTCSRTCPSKRDHGRREQHRACRRHHALQLAPNSRERDGSLSRLRASLVQQRQPVHAAHGHPAGGDVGVHGPRREEAPGPPDPRRQALPPRHQGHDAEPAHRRQSIREALRAQRFRGLDPPIDDTTTKIFTLYRTPRGERISRARFNGKSWAELTEEEHQRMPHDYEAQVGQGAITLHSEERLAASDRGVVVLRRLLRREIEAGNFILEPAG